MENKGVMIILRGIRNLLHEEPAKQYAIREGYTPEVLDVSGETGVHSAQTNLAVSRIKRGGVTAIYGFSGGGYNAVHVFQRLTDEHKEQIQQVVVLGSPGVKEDSFLPCPDITVYNDESVAHMDQPDNFLKITTPEVEEIKPPKLDKKAPKK